MDDTKLLSFIQIIPELNKYLVNDIICLIYEYLVSLHKIKYIFAEQFVSWIGEYTFGYCNFCGTKLWFKPNAATSISDLDEVSYKKVIKLLEDETHKRFIESLEDEYNPIDKYNLLCESLELILDHLESKIKNSREFKYVESKEYLEQELDYQKYLGQELDYDNNLYDAVDYDNIKEIDNIFIDLYPTSKIWIIHKKNEIINELHQIIKYCETKNIMWFWF
jgi:hypothetical protein